MPSGFSGSQYWSPNQFTGPGGYDWGNTDLGLILLEQSPETAFYRYGRQMGIPDDNSGFARWFANQFQDFAKGYSAYTVSDPINANIRDYTSGLGGYDDWMQRYQMTDQRVRGEDPSSRGAGAARWIGR